MAQKKAVKKTVAKKTAPKKAAPKKPAAKKKPAPKAPPAKKTAPRKPVAKKKAPAKTVAKKAAPKKAVAKKPISKKVDMTSTAKKKPVPVTRKPVTAGPAPSSEMGFTNFVPYVIKKGEKYMNDAQTVHFKNILTAWKQDLMEKVDQTVHHMQDEAGNIPDPNDRASLESDFTMELRARDRERKLIKKIEESFNHLDSGEYGYCENCGEEIGIRRLEARPTATLCIECKTLDEIREKHRI